ncbi:MAG TPA: nucleotidyltransferase domain-containing protein [Rhodothermales bacterium]|nr:nucleotidyltransferase domain-containing protein [Rhodothermales bacterium]
MPVKSKGAIDQLNVSPSVRGALHAARVGLHRLYGDRLRRLVLFGSQARGDAHVGSDIDLLVVLKEPVDKHGEFGRLGRLTTRIAFETGELVAFIVGDETWAADERRALTRRAATEGVDL